MSRCYPFVTCAFLVFAVACNSGGSGDDDAVVIDAGETVADAFVPPADSYSLVWGPVTVQPGFEETQCVTLALSNDQQIRVGRIHNQLTPGTSHHLIVYRVADDAVLNPTPENCDPFVDTFDPMKGSPIMVTQKSEDTLQLPDGVAFTLAANQKIRLEMHYVNTTDTARDVQATSTFIPMPEAEYQHEADFLFIGNISISLPPGQESTVGPAFLQIPAEYNGVNYFAVTGHTHKLGLNVEIQTAADSGDTTGAMIYNHEDWLWNEPVTSYFAPTFTLPDDGGFRFSCHYNNTSDQTVGFGESVGDEMCFFWAYYYPSRGSKVCATYGGLASACCPGAGAICDQIGDLLGN